MFWSFDKTNNEHLPKQFFKVIGNRSISILELQVWKENSDWEYLDAVHMYLDIWEDIFFPRFSLPSTHKQRFRAPKTQAFENGPQSGDFLRTPAYFRVDVRKRRFSNTMMSYFIQPVPYNSCYCICSVKTFLCGLAKTIRVRHVWTRVFSKTEKKLSVFKNKIWIRIDEALVVI